MENGEPDRALRPNIRRWGLCPEKATAAYGRRFWRIRIGVGIRWDTKTLGIGGAEGLQFRGL